MDIQSPFICCPVCAQRIPLRIDDQPTYHYWPDGYACDFGIPEALKEPEVCAMAPYQQ